MPYDNAASGLTATNTQAALDEIANVTPPSGVAISVIKSADETRTSTTTDAPDSELVVSILPGLYYVECMAWLDRASGADANHHLQVDCTGTANYLGFRRVYQQSGTTRNGQ